MKIQVLLDNLKIAKLNPLQEKAMAALAERDELIVLSPTGSGKTLAFLLPVVQCLEKAKKGVQCLILVPSRELALQIEQVFKQMGTGFKVNCCYGGHAVKTERNNLTEPPAVLIGTPGRIAYHLLQGNFDASAINILVLDEFDKALEFGFTADMSFIIGELFALKRRILTSATAMEEIPAFTGLKAPVVVDFLKELQIAPDIQLKQVSTTAENKLEALLQLICKIGSQTMLIFCNHRETVDRISDLLIDKDLVHDIFHGGMEQDERERALLKFRNGSIKILIATDLAARGLDIPEVSFIIHYQLPYAADAFLHRNGRTARMKAKGTVYVLLTSEEVYPYLPTPIAAEQITGVYSLPKDSEWQTLYLSVGRKDKVNKGDVLGFLLKQGALQKEEVGLIEIKDQASYVAVKRKLVPRTIKALSNQKIKNKKVKVETAM